MSNPTRLSGRPTPLQSLVKGAPTVLVLAIMAGGWMAVHEINKAGISPDQEETSQDQPLGDTLLLTEGKQTAGNFQSVAADSQPIQHSHTIPGRIRYDETKHIEVKAPMDGILSEILVTPGEQVQSGQLLAVIRSPEIGQARAEILKRQKQRDIAQQVLDRQRALTNNLEALAASLERGQDVKAIEAEFADRVLGNYRREILASYSQMQLSRDLLDSALPLAESGAISGRTIRERQADYQLAQTNFRAARDQATYVAKQDILRAEADLADADRQVSLAWEAVDALLGYEKDKATVDLNNEQSLTRLEIRAPFAGTVESRGYASNERVSRGAPLVLLANTESLYVAASIRESDWSAVSLKQGTTISVLVPALDNRVFEAKIRYFGREVQADTNAIPLVASIDNKEGLLRPGMFVRVTVPIGEPRNTLSVKPESVIQHEGQQFVFVDLDGGRYKRVDVTTGKSSHEWIEVTDGLSAGQLVVTNGAFLLKSELLLQGEGK